MKDQGVYSVNGESFSLLSSESRMLSGGAMLLHIATLSGWTRFELSGACTNVYTLDVTYGWVDSSGEELLSFKVKINGKNRGQFALKEGESKVLTDESTITLLNARRGTPDDNKGAEFELVCN